ncbi:hypothetical protein AWC20_07820 [Mycobacterium parmense]|nr:hypothetical protein AWC20_07820 [Mycobacterium parmense]
MRGFVSAHPALTTFGTLLIAVTAIAAGLKVVLAVSLSVAIVAAPVVLVVRSVHRRRLETAAIAARAEDQHAALLHGDEQWGVFGQKSPMSLEENSATLSSTAGRPRTWIIAGCTAAAAVILFAALVTHTEPSHRSSAPTSAPAIIGAKPPPVSPRHGAPAPAPFDPSRLIPPLPFPELFSPPTTVAPGPPTGVPAVIGQPAADGRLRFVVSSFDRSKTTGNPVVPFMQATAKGIFVNAHVTVTNTDAQPAVFFAAEQRFRVDGIVYDVDGTASLFTLTTAVAISPGDSVPVTLSFDVPTSTPNGGTLELHDSSASRGVNVALPPS